jgi:hypothetical protein
VHFHGRRQQVLHGEQSREPALCNKPVNPRKYREPRLDEE